MQLPSILTTSFFASALYVTTLMMGFTTAATALEFVTEPRQGQLLIGKVAPGQKVRFGNRQVRVSEDGYFAIGLGRDAKSEAELVVDGEKGNQLKHTFSVAQREYNIQRVNGVPAKTVNPPAEEMERIRKESALTRAARKQDLAQVNFLEQFQWPVNGPVSGVYGSQRIYNGQPRNPHYGLDIAAATGTPVKAPAGGTITLTHPGMFFNGGTIILDHGHGVASTFIHLSEVLVEQGQVVNQGDIIGKVGATGRASGPHLHWALNWFSERLDPELLLPPKIPEAEKPVQ